MSSISNSIRGDKAIRGTRNKFDGSELWIFEGWSQPNVSISSEEENPALKHPIASSNGGCCLVDSRPVACGGKIAVEEENEAEDVQLLGDDNENQ